MTRNQEIPFAKSLVDYIFRWLAMEFVPGYRAANAPKRPSKSPEVALPRTTEDHATPTNGGAAPATTSDPDSDTTATNGKRGNGHSGRLAPDAKPFDYDPPAPPPSAPVPQADPGGSALRLSLLADPLSQQGTELQADAPACDVCGSITVRSGTCYKCLNCGNSMGCS